MTLKIYFIVLLSFIMTGCMFSSGKVTVNNLKDEDKGPKKVFIENSTPYFVEMNESLKENGFTVMSQPTQVKLNEIQAKGAMSDNDESITRWGISLLTKTKGGWTCALTDSNILYFTLVLNDVSNNNSVMILKQLGSDGPCTTIKPVFPTLCKALSENW
ncbi:MAG: hypothetical protein QNK24_01855 [Desulfuromusa sp.]|nr:hypothetical protein [Desulfuromusa sp.]